jgi:hypothetical protein
MDAFAFDEVVPVDSPPDLEDLYDEQVLARIDGDPIRRAQCAPGTADDDDALVDGSGDDGPVSAADGTGEGVTAPASPVVPVIPRYPVARRLGLGGAVLAGAMLGVAEVVEPERAKHHIIDYVPDAPDEDEQLVTFHLVPDDPRASRLVVRPWLLERFRQRRGA